MLLNFNSLFIKYCIVITVYQIFVVLIKQCTYNMSLILNSCHCTFTHALFDHLIAGQAQTGQ